MYEDWAKAIASPLGRLPRLAQCQRLMTAGALACGWKADPALGMGKGRQAVKVVAPLALQPPQTQPRDLAPPCCSSNYPLHAAQAPAAGPCSPISSWAPNAESRGGGRADVEACQTVIDGGPRPTVVAGAVPDYHPTNPKFLIVDIPMGRSVGALHTEIQKCGLHDRSNSSSSGRVMIFVWQSGNLDDIHPRHSVPFVY